MHGVPLTWPEDGSQTSGEGPLLRFDQLGGMPASKLSWKNTFWANDRLEQRTEKTTPARQARMLMSSLRCCGCDPARPSRPSARRRVQGSTGDPTQAGVRGWAALGPTGQTGGTSGRSIRESSRDERLEAAVHHASAVEGHRLGVHAGEARILHDLGVDAI